MVGDEPLDVGLDIGGIIEQAFHIYDVVLGNGGEGNSAAKEIGVAQANVLRTNETEAKIGPVESNDDSCGMAGIPCDPNPAEDEDDDGW